MTTATKIDLHVIPVYFTVEAEGITQQQAAEVVGARLAGVAGMRDEEVAGRRDVEVSFRMPANPEAIGDTEAIDDPIMTYAEWPVTVENISDIVVTAMEGSYSGAPAWAASDKGYMPSRWLDMDADYMPVRDGVIVPDFEFVLLVDRETEEPFEDWDGRVTPELVRRGIYLWAQGPWSMGHDTMAGMIPRRTLADLFEDCDATDADNIIQLGAFGEVRFG